MTSEEEKKRARKQARAAPFSAKLDLQPDDEIVEMLPVADKLYVVTLSKIIRVHTPDDNDPELEHDDVPVTQHLVAECGSKHRTVARVLLQAKDAALLANTKEAREGMLNVGLRVTLELIEFENLIDELEKEIQTLQDEIQKDFDRFVTGFSPKPLPSVRRLEQKFRSAAQTSNQALNYISDLFPATFREEFKRGRFDNLIRWSEQKYGKDDVLTWMLRGDHRWIYLWGEVRNAIEHPSKTLSLNINNFRLLPNREIQLPTWQLQHPKLDDVSRPQQMIVPLKLHLSNIIGFFENLLLVLLEKSISTNFVVGYDDLDESERDPKRPVRYRFQLIPRPKEW